MTELNFLALVPTELFVIAVVTYVLVEGIKMTNKVPNWCLPIVALIIAIILTILYTAFILSQGINSTTIINGIIYGVLIAAVAVYSNQFIKQLIKKN